MWNILLNPRTLIAVVLAAVLGFTHYLSYKAGASAIRAEWNAQTTMLAQETLKQSEAARAKEQDLQAKVRKVSNDLQIEKNRRAADAANADDGLRQLQATIDSAASGDSATTIGVDDLARARIVVGQCAKALTELAAVADSTEARLIGLQEYVRSVVKVD